MFGQKKQQDTFEYVPKGGGEQSQIKTLISEGCKFEGNLYSPAYTRIDGIINGNLTGESGLIIGQSGKITGDVTSVEVVVYGDVKGNVKAHKLEIKKGGKVAGDIDITQLLMENGALYNGNVKMNENAAPDKNVFEVPEEN